MLHCELVSYKCENLAMLMINTDEKKKNSVVYKSSCYQLINQSISEWEKTLETNQDDHHLTIEVSRDL